MKKTFAIVAVLLTVAASAFAEDTDVASATGSLNTKPLTGAVPNKLVLAYDPAWLGASSCTLKLNGQALANGSRAGTFTWTPSADGIYSFSLEGGGKTLRTTCIVGSGNDVVSACGTLDAYVGLAVADQSRKTLKYDPAWLGASSCMLKLNGRTLASGSSAGTVAWTPTTDGIYSFTLEGGGKTLQSTCIVGSGNEVGVAKGMLEAFTGMVQTDQTDKSLAYDPSWLGGSSCSIKVNGTVVVNDASSAGKLSWKPEGDGIYSFEIVGGGKSLVNTMIVGTGVGEGEGIGAVDTNEDFHFVGIGENKKIAYSPNWDGSTVCAVRENEKEVVRSATEGVFDWSAAESGRYQMEHETESGVLKSVFTVLDEEVVLHKGTVGADEVWSKDRVHLIASSVVSVPANVSLTIEPGAVVKFATGSTLAIDHDATCVAEGTIFTHIADDTAGGDTLYDGDETKPECGMYTITGPIYDDDTTEYRYSPPVVTSGTITQDTIWRSRNVYHVTGNLTIASGVTLTIMPGAIIKFANGCSLKVNGTLDAQGTRAAPIVFTSAKDDEWGGDTNGDGNLTYAQAGDWASIYVYNGGSVNCDYVKILYGGNNGNTSTADVFYLSGGAVSFRNSFMEHAYQYCVGLESGSWQMENSVFADFYTAFRHFASCTCVNSVFYDFTYLSNNGGQNFTNCVIMRFNTALCWWTDDCVYKNCVIYNPVGFGPQSSEKCGYNGNIWADPKFLNPDEGDFHIAADSPCKDTADSTVAPEFDYYGQPRVGAAADIGVCEVMPRHMASDVDLRVSDVDTVSSVMVGDELVVTWVVENIGCAATHEVWRDKVELVSPRGERIPLGERMMKTGLAAGGLQTCRGSWKMPVVAEGEYTVLVTVNYARDVFEGTLTENNIMSSDCLNVSVPTVASVDGASFKLGAKDEHIVHFTIRPDSQERMITISASESVHAFFGTQGVPMESANIGSVSSSNGVIAFAVPNGATDVYVRLVNEGKVDVDCTVEFTALGVKILNVSPQTVPYDGKVTVRIEGAGLDCVQSVAFRAANSSKISCDGWRIDSSGLIVMSVDGAKLTQGTEYQLELVDVDGIRTDSEQKLSVTLESAKPDMWVKLNTPEIVREGREYLCTIEYGNRGNADALAPVLAVVVVGGGKLKRIDDDELAPHLTFVGAGGAGDGGVLSPGESRKITFAYVAGSSDRISLQVREEPDVSAAAARMGQRGCDATDYFAAKELAEKVAAGEPSGVYYGYVKDTDGYPVSGYYVSITNGQGVVMADAVTDWRGYYVTEASMDMDEHRDISVSCYSPSSYVLVDGSDETTSVVAFSRVNGDSYNGECVSNGIYVFRGIADGGYVVKAQGEGDKVAVTGIYVTNGDYGEIKLVLGEKSTITGSFKGDGTEVDPKVYLVGSDREYIARVGVGGRFEFAGLPAGDYVLMYFGTNYVDYTYYTDIELMAGQQLTCDIQKTNNLHAVSSSFVKKASMKLSGKLQSVSEVVTEDNLDYYVMLVAQNCPIQPPSDRNCKHNKERYQQDVKSYNAVVNLLNSASYKLSEKKIIQAKLDKNQRDLWWMLGGSAFSILGKARKFYDAISKFKNLAQTLKLIAKTGELGVSLGGMIDVILDDDPGEKALSIGQILCNIDDLAINAEYALSQFKNLAQVKASLYEVWAAHKIWLLRDYSKYLDGIDEAFKVMGEFLGLVEACYKGIEQYNLLQERDAIDADLQASLIVLNSSSGVQSVLKCRDYPLCCVPPPPKPDPVQTNKTNNVTSNDPNEMIGPLGMGSFETQRFVRSGEWLTYTVYFENQTNATAAAQEVYVANPLSEYLDWSTFEMCEVVFNNQMDHGLLGKKEGTSEVTMSGTNYVVRTEVDLDEKTGVVTWYLRIVDPVTVTGWPEDVFAGFLPPNDETHRGEGHITYRVKVREDAPNGVRIDNSATIVFDYNDPIETDPAWWNTVAQEKVVKVTVGGVETTLELIVGQPYGELPDPGAVPAGHSFGGWFTGPNGTGRKITADSIVQAGDGGLFQQWLPNTYKLNFNANGGTVSPLNKNVTFGTALGTLPTPTRSGYSFSGWKIGGVAVTAASIFDWTADQTATAQWTMNPPHIDPTPTPPSGPTAAEISDPANVNYDPTSAMFVPPELYQTKAQNDFVGNVQYLGWVRDANGALKGSLLVKAAKEKKKDHTSKLSVSYTPIGGKKTTIKNLQPVNPAVGGKPVVVIPEVGTVTIGDDSFASADNLVQVGQDFTKSKDKAAKARATSRLAGKVGNYTFALGLNGRFVGFTVAVDKKGKGKLVGVLPDGTKVSISAQGVLGDCALAIPFVYSKKGSFGLVFWMYDNGTLGVSDLTAFKNAAGQLQSLTWHGVSGTHELAAGSSHQIACAVDSGTAQTFSVVKNKWTFPKKDANPCSWKMSYKAKDGSAKGQFTIRDANGKKVKYTVNGAVVGRTFYGTAYNKKAGSFPVAAK